MVIQCASCGAESRIVNPASVSVTCEYCGTISLLVDETWTDSGKESRLSQGFSKLYRGAVCQIGGRNFQVLGRVRYSFGRGFWDEWFVQEDTGERHWITEDDHDFALQQRVDTPASLNNVHALSVGDQLEVSGVVCQISEIGYADCLGIEGELPQNILPNERYVYADGTSLDGQYTVGVEFDETVPTVYWGKWVPAKDIVCHEP